MKPPVHGSHAHLGLLLRGQTTEPELLIRRTDAYYFLRVGA